MQQPGMVHDRSRGLQDRFSTRTLVFPSYDGNGMFKSLGNLVANPWVALLFIDFETPKRLRVNGRAVVRDDDPLRCESPGAQLIVRVQPAAIFPKCSRYIHTMKVVEESVYAPREGYMAPAPAWKQRPEFCEVLPPDGSGSTASEPGDR